MWLIDWKLYLDKFCQAKDGRDYLFLVEKLFSLKEEKVESSAVGDSALYLVLRYPVIIPNLFLNLLL